MLRFVPYSVFYLNLLRLSHILSLKVKMVLYGVQSQELYLVRLQQ